MMYDTVLLPDQWRVYGGWVGGSPRVSHEEGENSEKIDTVHTILIHPYNKLYIN